ncbi:cysteine ABC transporter, ATP-binding protein [Lachnospiraceae bacterium KM106-2]|nr:cysteine ABC transporter, ATP-binding protein [Lachnospiraceae bacterium KM106-2]
MINKRLMNLLEDSKKYVVKMVIWNWIALLCNVVFIFSFAYLVEHMLSSEITTAQIGAVAAIDLCMIVIRAICHKQNSKASFHAAAGVKKVLREKIYYKLLSLGSSYEDKIATAEIVQVSGEGVEQLEIYFGKYLAQLFYSLLAPITLFVILAFVNLKTSAVLLACVPFIPLSIVAVQKFAKKLLSKYWGIYTGLGDTFLENLQGLTTMKIYEADERKTVEMDQNAEQFRKVTMRVLIMQLNSISVMDLVAYGGAGLGIITAVYEFSNGNLTVGGLFAIVLLSSEFFIPLRLLGSFFHIAMNGMAASKKIFRILDLEESNDQTEEIEDAEFEIKLDQVGFAYEETRTILNGVSLTIPNKGFVSLVGESGCGKSTITNLIMGRNKDYTGSILVGEKELSTIKEESIMNTITLVTHNAIIFKGTVEENLRMAKPDATKEELLSALKQVNLLDFMMEQDGLDTLLQEQGANLSGGQKQRLSLARAILHDTPVYIFDEATSNIDAESEAQIMEVIHQLAKSKTIILISHRLENVVDSDCIYTMDGGLVVEMGTHKELMAKQNVYAKLYQMQKDLENYGKEAGNNEA